MTFAVIALGSFVGTFFGNLSLFWLIGRMAKRAERQQTQAMEALKAEYMALVQKEQERMERYAELES